MLPLNPGVKLTTSCAISELASVIASLSEQSSGSQKLSLVSAVLVTVSRTAVGGVVCALAEGDDASMARAIATSRKKVRTLRPDVMFALVQIIAFALCFGSNLLGAGMFPLSSPPLAGPAPSILLKIG